MRQRIRRARWQGWVKSGGPDSDSRAAALPPIAGIPLHRHEPPLRAQVV
jgi:hypothetical protein